VYRWQGLHLRGSGLLRQNRLCLTIAPPDKQFGFAAHFRRRTAEFTATKLAFVAEKTALNCVQVQTRALLARQVGGRLANTEYQLRGLG
jgi:hypothetical protein